MAVPAAPILIVSGMSLRALTTAWVSSQSDKLFGNCPPHKAWTIRARLLMLFDAGRFIVASRFFGAIISYVDISF